MKSNSISAFALTAGLLTGFASCSNDDFDSTVPTQEETDTNKADYTVIFWGDAGNNDHWAVSDMADLILDRENGKITDKVNFVGCFTPSAVYSEGLTAKNLGGTLEFELGTKENTSADTLSVFKSIAGVENEDILKKKADVDYPNYYSQIMHSMKSCKANSEYNIENSSSLAQFITKAAKEHPAKNYVLMFYGHGNGYNPAVEGCTTATSRGCVVKSDDESTYLHLEDVTNAIKNSGVKIQTVFYQCCSMATLENFAGMKDCTDYVVASAEPTEGGYFPTFITYLNEAGSSADGMKSACKKIVDFYKENSTDYADNINLSSQGFYDLSKTDELLASVKQASTWFAAAAKSNPEYMKDVVYNSVNSFSSSYDYELHLQNLNYETAKVLKKSIRATFDSDRTTVTSPDKLMEILGLGGYLCAPNNTPGTCFASIMHAALSDEVSAEATGLDLAALKTIYNNYMTTLKSMAYIRCNGEEGNDAAYLYASPTVNLFCMNEQGYFPTDLKATFNDEAKLNEAATTISQLATTGDHKGVFAKFIELYGGTQMAVDNASLATVKANYQATAFDKATGWSQVLENIKYNPIRVFNPSRYDATN